MMNDQKPLTAQVAEILQLPPDVSEADILRTLTAWATERHQAQHSAAFEGRIAALTKQTNMPREEAILCLQAQDAAATQLKKELSDT